MDILKMMWHSDYKSTTVLIGTSFANSFRLSLRLFVSKFSVNSGCFFR